MTQHRSIRRAFVLAPALFVLGAAAGATSPSAIEVDDVQLVLVPPARQLAVLHMAIRNQSPASDALVEASVMGAGRTALHGGAGGHMSQAQQISIDARTRTVMSDKGPHVMAEQLSPNLRAGQTTTVRLRFARAGAMTVQARIVDAPSGGHGHH